MDGDENEGDSKMTTYPLEIPSGKDELWRDWKQTVPRTYRRVGDRLLEFVERDLKSRETHNEGLLERFETYVEEHEDES